MDLIGKRNVNLLVDLNAQLQPNEVFIISENSESVTWEDFSKNVNLYASSFLNVGIKKGTKVVVHYRTSLDLLFIMFGLYKIGAIAVMSNTSNTKKELSYIIEHSNSKYIVLEGYEKNYECINHIVLEHEMDRILIDQDLNLDKENILNFKKYIKDGDLDEVLPEISISSDDPATMIFTSGTTARPKGVIYTHGNHLFSGEVLSKILLMDRNDTFMHHFPLFHMNGLGQIFAVLTVGCKLLLFERFRSSMFIERVEKFRPTITHLNSTHIKMILNFVKESNYKNFSFKSVGFALQMSDEFFDKFEEIFGSVLIELYALTESIAIPLANHYYLKRKRHSCGLPTLGYDVKIVDDKGQEKNPYEHGEIILKCYSKHGIMTGYYNNLEATKSTIRDGWLYTGDIGYYDDEGYFYMVDRRKDIIKRAGENISAREVEEVIESHPLVSEAAVIGIFDELREEVPKAYVVRKDNSLSEERLIEYCKKRLAAFKIPQQIEFWDQLPKTAVGKVEKKILRSLNEQRSVNN